MASRPSDVVVVGAGIVGCAVAYELARRGASVQVVDERPYEIRPTERPAVWMYDLGIVYTGEGELDTDHVKALFQDAFAQAWRDDIETDGFNRLVLRAQLSGREIAVRRAVGFGQVFAVVQPEAENVLRRARDRSA